jgi:hypothetical protein
MCQHKSAIWTRKGLLYSLRWDSHEKIIEENKLNDTTNNPDFVRIEFVPKNGIWEDYLKPENYVLRVGQDFRPNWFYDKDPELKKQCLAMIKRIWDETFVFDKSNIELSDKLVYAKNSKRLIVKNSSAELRGNSSAELRENSSAVLWENSSAVLRENSSAELRENSSAVLWGNSSAELRENSSAVLRENS